MCGHLEFVIPHQFLFVLIKKSRAFVILANGKRSDSIAHPKWIELCTICGKETGNERARARLIIMESKLQYINWTIHPMKVLNEVQCNNIIVKMSTTGERKTPKSRWPNERMTKQLNTVSLRRKQILEAFECKVLYFFSFSFAPFSVYLLRSSHSLESHCYCWKICSQSTH